MPERENIDRSAGDKNQSITNNSSITQTTKYDSISEEALPREFSTSSLINKFRVLESSSPQIKSTREITSANTTAKQTNTPSQATPKVTRVDSKPAESSTKEKPLQKQKTKEQTSLVIKCSTVYDKTELEEIPKNVQSLLAAFTAKSSGNTKTKLNVSVGSKKASSDTVDGNVVKVAPASQIRNPEEEKPKDGTVEDLLQTWNSILNKKRQNSFKPFNKRADLFRQTSGTPVLNGYRKIPDHSDTKKKVHFNEEVEEVEESGVRLKRRSVTEEEVDHVDNVDNVDSVIKRSGELPWSESVRGSRDMFESMSKPKPKRRWYQEKPNDNRWQVTGPSQVGLKPLNSSATQKSTNLAVQNQKPKVVSSSTTQNKNTSSVKPETERKLENSADGRSSTIIELREETTSEVPQENNTKKLLEKFMSLQG